MTVAEVTVQYVNPPKGRARSGSIKDTSGAYYGIDWPGMQNDFKPGCTYKVEYEQNGQFRNVKRSQLVAEGTAPTATKRQDVSPDVARRMFVGACMHGFAASVGAESLTPALVASVISALEKGYDIHYSRATREANPAPAKAAPRDDMNDEIPW